MQRYFVKESAKDEYFTITGDDQRHISKVMRMAPGNFIICVDSKGNSAECEIAEITDEKITAKIVKWIEGSPELPVQVTIVSGLPKGDKLELVIQKGTELGAYEFIPFISARSIVKWDAKKADKKLDRWNKICKEAAEQSHRTILPAVTAPVQLQELIKLAESYDQKLIAFEESAKEGEASMLSQTLQQLKRGQSLLIVFGPEGGLTEQEVTALQEQGFITCGLGPRILRTETAPLYALAAVSYHFELMG
ncbi:16S rRNA (uracil(1498)-N(3))-methyltransferase [Bacillus mesophilum]|uniref:Ribosomal RNA small subunit methyltransferase E n=1 Tax=Bacillus mesophilum TaxID=1071718 RepID=A0A7V7RN98_9BACI|nr:16S rRNA (uracil(1498)-N(3))-methyltransferase [Bacillus mesophilum]KAB2333920.1 16S rRNA (uracil(1498)-N(3))-methyltransferase [Bacillus mesophilum]